MLAAVTAPASAQRVRDEGQFFSPDAIAKVESQLNDLQRQSGRQVAVETYGDAPAAVTSSGDLSNPASRAAAFEKFGQSRAKQLGADIYVLVNRSPSHLRVVERSDGKQAPLPNSERERIAQAMLASFRDRQFDQGLMGGVAALSQSLTSAPAAGAGARGNSQPNTPAATPPTASREFEPKGSSPTATRGEGSGGFGMGTWLLLIVGAFILFRIVRGFLSRRQATNPYGSGQFGGPGQPQQGPFGQQQGPYSQQGGYGQQAPGGFGGGGGAFGRGMMGGVLGGVLGSVLGSRIGHGQQQQSSDPNTGAGADPNSGGQDPGYSSSGGDFDSGGDAGGGDSSGGDF